MDLDSRILLEIKDKYLTVSQLVEIIDSPYEGRVDVRIKQLRKWNMVAFKRVDTGARGKKPLAYIASATFSV